MAIVPFGLQHKAFADVMLKDGMTTGPNIEYGYLTFTKPIVSVTSYARSESSKVVFALAITNENEYLDKSGFVVGAAAVARGRHARHAEKAG